MKDKGNGSKWSKHDPNKIFCESKIIPLKSISTYNHLKLLLRFTVFFKCHNSFLVTKLFIFQEKNKSSRRKTVSYVFYADRIILRSKQQSETDFKIRLLCTEEVIQCKRSKIQHNIYHSTVRWSLIFSCFARLIHSLIYPETTNLLLTQLLRKIICSSTFISPADKNY